MHTYTIHSIPRYAISALLVLLYTVLPNSVVEAKGVGPEPGDGCIAAGAGNEFKPVGAPLEGQVVITWDGFWALAKYSGTFVQLGTHCAFKAEGIVPPGLIGSKEAFKAIKPNDLKGFCLKDVVFSKCAFTTEFAEVINVTKFVWITIDGQPTIRVDANVWALVVPPE